MSRQFYKWKQSSKASKSVAEALSQRKKQVESNSTCVKYPVIDLNTTITLSLSPSLTVEEGRNIFVSTMCLSVAILLSQTLSSRGPRTSEMQPRTIDKRKRSGAGKKRKQFVAEVNNRSNSSSRNQGKHIGLSLHLGINLGRLETWGGRGWSRRFRRRGRRGWSSSSSTTASWGWGTRRSHWRRCTHGPTRHHGWWNGRSG